MPNVNVFFENDKRLLFDEEVFKCRFFISDSLI